VTAEPGRGRPLPIINELTEPYWRAAREHRLVIQGCRNCGRRQFPAVEECPDCGGSLTWTASPGLGRLHTFTVFHRAYHPGFADDVPYNVSIVELDEGPLVMTNVVGCDNSQLVIGMRLAVVFDDIAPDVSLPKFAPAPDADTAQDTP
jgi:uncharacterized protein